MDQQAPINAEELLSWYRDAGVDVCLEDAPVDRFSVSVSQVEQSPPSRAKAIHSQKTETPAKAAIQQKATVPDSATIERARELVDSCDTLESLKQAVESFDGCNLKFSARSTVFADGNPEAKLMVIGEAPGRDEDMQGLPFVGRSGALLDRMLGAIGLDRSQVYISNILPWRPPGNRAPTPMETEICRPFVERHIELAAPDLLLLVGGSSAKTLMKTDKGILSLRGRWTEVDINGKSFAAMPSLHPAYLLRQPLQKRHAWQDLLAVAAKIEELSTIEK